MATAASAQDYDFLIATEAKNTVNESGMEILVPYDYKMVADGEEIVVKNCYVSYIDNNPDDYYASYYLMAYTKIVNKTKNDITLTFNSVETEKAVTNAEELGFSTEFGHCLGGQCIASDPFNATVEANSSTSDTSRQVHRDLVLQRQHRQDFHPQLPEVCQCRHQWHRGGERSSRILQPAGYPRGRSSGWPDLHQASGQQGNESYPLIYRPILNSQGDFRAGVSLTVYVKNSFRPHIS